MLDTLALGAGALTETNPSTPQYTLTNTEKGNILNGTYSTSRPYKKDMVTLSPYYFYEFVPRTFLKGATPENGYAPNGNQADINDKTKWKITVDQYVYCFDQVDGDSDDADPVVKTEPFTLTVQPTDDNGNPKGEVETFPNWVMPALHKDATAVTVCPTPYGLMSETGTDFATKEHGFAVRIGMQYSSKKNVWIPCDNVSINKVEHGKIITPIKKYLASTLFSSSKYVAPEDANDDL